MKPIGSVPGASEAETNNNRRDDRGRLDELYQSLGLPSGREAVLIARSGNTGIWHTEKTASNDCPWGLPPDDGHAAIYRGCSVERLGAVLESGIDVPDKAAFFASPYPDKGWEYPLGRKVPTLLVLDRDRAERSFRIQPADAGDTWIPDENAAYPNVYTDAEGAARIHTRFDDKHLPGCFRDENMYGFWIPGDARDALLDVVIGGPLSAITDLLRGLPLSGSHSIELIR